MAKHYIGTAIYLIAMAVIFVTKCGWEMDANEIGDFLAGAAAPAAFYWLILGYFLQRDELKLQREEITRLTETQNQQTELLSEANLLEAASHKRLELDTYSKTMINRIRTIKEELSKTTMLKGSNGSGTISWGLNQVNMEDFPGYCLRLIKSWEKSTRKSHGAIHECMEATIAGWGKSLSTILSDEAAFISHGLQLQKSLMTTDFTLYMKSTGYLSVITLLNYIVNDEVVFTVEKD